MVLHVVTATATTSRSTYMLRQLLGLLVVVHLYLNVMTANGTTLGTTYIQRQSLRLIVVVLTSNDS